MKKLLALITLALVVFVIVYRQRIFLRDPLAAVTRDGVKVDGAIVMINYSNDVLLEDRSAGKHRLYLVQHWNKKAEVPTAPLTCLQGLACMTDADRATASAILPNVRERQLTVEGVTMTDRRVKFPDEDGRIIQAFLR